MQFDQIDKDTRRTDDDVDSIEFTAIKCNKGSPIGEPLLSCAKTGPKGLSFYSRIEIDLLTGLARECNLSDA
jgi:hypothetical protein